MHIIWSTNASGRSLHLELDLASRASWSIWRRRACEPGIFCSSIRSVEERFFPDEHDPIRFHSFKFLNLRNSSFIEERRECIPRWSYVFFYVLLRFGLSQFGAFLHMDLLLNLSILATFHGPINFDNVNKSSGSQNASLDSKQKNNRICFFLFRVQRCGAVDQNISKGLVVRLSFF